ncbi:MAG: oligoendopeptidase F [Planctomycetaceae bacterium]|nr:oligoendopeptidase F [Planctomycetaceae bacterium]
MKRSRRTFLKQTAGLAAASLALQNKEVMSPALAQDEKLPETMTVPLRSNIAEAEKWDLSSLFHSDEQCKAKIEFHTKQIPVIFKGIEENLTKIRKDGFNEQSALEILSALNDAERVVYENLERITVYAYLRYSEDLADPKAQELKGLADMLTVRTEEAASFVKPELLALPDEFWEKYLAGYKQFALKYKRILRQKPHILSKNEEQILAAMSDVAQTASKAFNLLNNADLKFGTIQNEKGQTVEVSTGSFQVLMNSPDRNVRKKAFQQFYAGYKSHENTLGSLLAGSIQKDVFYAKVKKFPSALDAALFHSEIPKGVYDNLITTVNKFLPVLHRYYEIRRQKMGLDDIHMYDVYVPVLSGIKTHYPWEKGVETIAKALAPLGGEYVDILTAGLTTERWCDRYENKGKRSGAFSSGSFSGKPYILMNYKPDVIDSLFTLAHEGGHSMHSYYSAKNQPFIYYDYVTFVAEVASTFNEDMLTRYLLSQTDDKKMKAWLINHQIDSIRQTLFRQTMFAEFEQRTHEAAEKGETLTAASLQAAYRKLLEAYFGPKFVLDDELPAECLRVPHFYRAFYVYQYATGISAALSLAERVSAGGEKERNDYLKFLSGGCSATPAELLRTAGVDMESPLPIESAMKRFEKLVNEWETLI